MKVIKPISLDHGRRISNKIRIYIENSIDNEIWLSIHRQIAVILEENIWLPIQREVVAVSGWHEYTNDFNGELEDEFIS